jgi:hypothetical protein
MNILKYYLFKLFIVFIAGRTAGGGSSWLYSKVVEPVVSMVRNVFTQGLTPELMSLSLAFGMPLPRVRAGLLAATARLTRFALLAGITGGLFPIPGVTTIICGVFVYLFGLNLAACQLMNVLLVGATHNIAL